MVLKIVKKQDIKNPHRATVKTVWQPIALNIEKFPKDLSNFVVKPIELSALNELFENEPSAEELLKCCNNHKNQLKFKPTRFFVRKKTIFAPLLEHYLQQKRPIGSGMK